VGTQPQLGKFSKGRPGFGSHYSSGIVAARPYLVSTTRVESAESGKCLADGCSTPKAPQGRPQTSQISAFRHKVRQYPLVAPHNSLANA
jgi:hypothetical protein